MHRKRAFLRSRFVKDVVSWLQRLVGSRSEQGLREAPSPSVPGRVPSVPSRQEVGFECSSVDEDEVSLAKELRELPEVSLQLVDLQEWKLTAYGDFFREENIFVLEARSI